MKKIFMIPIFIFLLTACGKEPTATITKAEYQKLKEGMSYDEVKEIVGGEAESINEIDDHLVEYSFKGEGGAEKDATVTLLFNDEKLDTIIEDGLLEKRKKLTKEEEAEIEKQNREAVVISEIKDILYDVFGDKATYNDQNPVQEVKYNEDTNTLHIKVMAKDGFSNKGIKEGIWMDITETIKQLSNRGYGTVSFDILFPLVDKHGNEENGSVIKASFDKDTLAKINWENFNYKNIPDVATTYWQHSDFN